MLTKGWPILLVLLLAACGRTPNPSAPVPTPVPSTTGGEVGNGGHGILINGKMVLYDLWEAGLVGDDKKFVWVPGNVNPKIVGYFGYRLEQTLPEGKFPLREVSWKLAEIYAVDPVAAYALAEAIQAYRWTLVDRLAELNLKDRVMVHKDQKVALIANRTGRFIHVSREMWKLMDGAQRTALIFHEAIFSLAPPIKVQLANGTLNFQQNAKRVREITAVFFGLVNLTELQKRGLYDFVDAGEIPLISRQNFLLGREEVTLSFLSKEYAGLSVGLDPSTLALIGPAAMQLRPAGATEFFAFPLRRSGLEEAKQISALCKKLVDAKFPGFTTSLQFARGDTVDSYELKFATYSDHGELKSYIQHQPLTKATDLPLMKDGALKMSMKSLKVQLDKTMRKLRGEAIDVFELTPAEHEDLTITCEAEVKAYLAKVGLYLFPSQWPTEFGEPNAVSSPAGLDTPR